MKTKSSVKTVLLSLLGENIFKIQYLLAFLLISGGIILGNKSEGKK